jgi:hypothetical protein
MVPWPNMRTHLMMMYAWMFQNIPWLHQANEVLCSLLNGDNWVWLMCKQHVLI